MNNSSSNSNHRTPRTRSGRMGEPGPEAPRRPLSSQGDSVCSVGGAGAGSCFLSRLGQLPCSPLSRAQLRRLEEHRYSSAGRSLLEPLMQHYWEWLVKRVPTWVAPNLITIMGLVTNIATTLVLVYYCPTATEQNLCRRRWYWVATSPTPLPAVHHPRLHGNADHAQVSVLTSVTMVSANCKGHSIGSVGLIKTYKSA